MKRWVEWVRTNTGLKLVSLLLASFVWFFVKAVTSDWRTVEGVQLEIRVHSGMQVVNSSTRYVNVTVRGAQEDLRQASRNELFAVLDLTDEKATGRVIAPLTAKMIRHPRRVQVVAVEPTNIVVRIEPMTE